MKQILAAILFTVFIVSLVAFLFTYNQVTSEQQRLTADIQYRSSLLANSLKESVEPNFINKSDSYLQSIVERFIDQQRIAGLAVLDSSGKVIALSSSLPKNISDEKQIATDVMDADMANGKFITVNGNNTYIFASPLHNESRVVGSLIIIQNAGYIDTRLSEIWKNNLLRLSIQIFLIATAVLLILWWLIYIPITNLVKSIKLVRQGKKPPRLFNNSFFRPLIEEVGNMQLKLTEARLAASQEARLRIEKIDSPWTAERLKVFVAALLKGRKILVVSNREPYIHTKKGNNITYYTPASGVVTALEPVMQATSGTWIAHGSGDADKLVVDKHDNIQVPPDDPKYTLKRIWLSEKEENGYYVGFCNECIWPLTHSAHVRPTFRQEDWEEYKKVNEKFAATVLEEIKDLKRPIILVQDFHPSLIPRIIKDKRPDALIGLFWHEPWVSAEAFSICPWKKEILDGMLGADLIGFHTQLHCNNFIETVGRELESLIDYERFSVTRKGHVSFIKPFPISIAFSKDDLKKTTRDTSDIQKMKKQLEDLGIESEYIGIGVERLDYIKGILERLKALEVFFRNYPQYKEKFTFIQIASPSRSKVKKYQEFAQAVEQEVERVNTLFKTRKWKPIVFLKRHHSHEELKKYYETANVCLVTPLHDGMNLVAKEYVASRNDEQGVLVLSQFAGASKQFKDAIIVNPYNADQTADAIFTALEMKPAEQTTRMQQMRNSIRNYNVYRWSAELLQAIIDLD